MNCEYWFDSVEKLKTQSVWASHVLATCIDEEDSNLNKALNCVDEEKLIENVIFAYEKWDSQPNCDEILFMFDRGKLRTFL